MLLRRSYEKRPSRGETLIYLINIRLLLRRLT
jgi:hypothetical protein